jgi:formamidopyrimidine-DNA glycosylase
MPELAEVEHARRIVERIAGGRRITDVWCADDEIVVSGTTASEVVSALRGATVTGAGRRGKHLWLELDRRPWLLLHFGMTGAIRSPGDDPIPLETSAATVDQAWPPRFCKLHFTLDDGGRLGFVNARRLGRIRLRDHPLLEPPISKLGFDPLLDLPQKAEFARLVRRRKIPIKALLLDQKFAAGVGNWIADEVLFQARVRPRRRADRLRLYEIEALRVAIGEVVRIAVEVDARKDAFPADWLFHRRWGKKSDATTLAGDSIRHDRIGGRTTAWVPAVQR